MQDYLQSTLYSKVVTLSSAGESAPPADVQRAFNTVVRAIEAGALRPGARGFEVEGRRPRIP
jgi:hypothetical protein